MRYFILWLVLPFMVFPYMVILYWVALAWFFSPWILSHCYCQVDKIFTLISDYSSKLMILKCLISIQTKQLLVAIEVHKLQSLILLVTRRIVLLVQCILPKVPIFQQNPWITWIIKLLKTKSPQNLILASSVNFVIKSFQDFTLYDNIKTPNMDFLSRQQWLILTISTTKWKIRISETSCVHVNISSEILSLKTRYKVFNYAVGNLNEAIMNEKLDVSFINLKLAAKVNLTFWSFKKIYRRWRFQILLRTPKQ